MRDFFKTTRFKVLVGILALLLVLMIVSAATGGRNGGFLTVVTTPVSKLSSKISGYATEFFGNIANSAKNAKENKDLRSEINSLREQLIDYYDLKEENEQLKEMMGLKEANKDMDFAPAAVIGRDADDRYGSFQIDKGSLHGIELYDPVVTRDGLVGYVTKVNPISSRVSTILNTDVNVGAYGLYSGETGVVTGDPVLAQNGQCKLKYLLRESAIAKGELVVTTGLSGIFPKGLIVGTVEKLVPETGGSSVYAIIQPAAQIEDAKNVFVITSFTGQGLDKDDVTSSETSSNQTSSSASQEGSR